MFMKSKSGVSSEILVMKGISVARGVKYYLGVMCNHRTRGERGDLDIPS